MKIAEHGGGHYFQFGKRKIALMVVALRLVFLKTVQLDMLIIIILPGMLTENANMSARTFKLHVLVPLLTFCSAATIISNVLNICTSFSWFHETHSSLMTCRKQ